MKIQGLVSCFLCASTLIVTSQGSFLLFKVMKLEILFQVEVIKKAYLQGEVEFEDGENGEDLAASPRNVGHNIYILAHQVPLHLYI